MNIGLRGVETTHYWMSGHNGQRPATPAGRAALHAHNDALQAIIAELTEIQAQPDITGQCGQCEASGSS
jgi:hypothetical protein